MRKVRAGVVQAAPVFMNLRATLDKTIALIEQAAKDDVELLAFPELWIPGYPWFIWVESPIEWYRHIGAYHANSLAVDSSEMRAIRDAAAKASMHVVLGYSEKATNSRYMSQSLILPNGEIGFARRKIKPTSGERMLFGEGDGSDLKVLQTSIGRIGALNCWENLLSFCRNALIGMHEEIHIGAWPSMNMGRGLGTADQFGPNKLRSLSTVTAIEGSLFCLTATSVFAKDQIDMIADTELKAKMLLPDESCLGGFSMIYGPDGMPLVEPLDENREGIVVADLDLDLIPKAKLFFDPAGHYTRNDIFRFDVNHASRRGAHDAGLTAVSSSAEALSFGSAIDV
ncbi:carbon-nitrogen hydrolase family protein [Bradyrhizobium jicamae]|uniref:Carbon-nitrogen hydrolase family protein n=1 Tax=Bradyrhizobium jicamae TaxID=280332 RepID=A0ABS5FDR4_9BRAD|nr:carbon-nitrogen hydrolase family protein [Bradyrhizobium jicamae]MBR0794918.1 carbon-nitrogen hydrolase family protein [Bradyrhizobium jicamae]